MGNRAHGQLAYGVAQTFQKGLMVMEALGSCGARGVSLIELARQVGLHKGRVYRLVATLQRSGYVERADAEGRYRLTSKILTVAAAVLNDLDVRRAGSAYLVALSEQVRETVHLTIVDRDEVVTVERIEGDHPLSLRTQIGARRPLYCTATGRAALAFMEQEVIRRVLSQELKPLTSKTITDATVIEGRLQEIRVRGYAIDDEEFAEGVRCVAAPIFDYRCDAIGAISVAVPTFRTGADQLTVLAGPVVEAARQVSERLGFRQAMMSGQPRAATPG